MIQHAWLQKHASPVATSGEFHWYPDRGDRELRACFVERVRGIEPPAVLWQFERGRVAWGQVFSAIAPTDGRRYVGLVLSVNDAGSTPAELVAALAPPAAEPWHEGVPLASAGHAGPLPDPVSDGAVAIARALISGGTARVGDVRARDLPQRVGALERVMPSLPVRHGTWFDGVASAPPDRVAELAVAACREPASRLATAWTLLGELAAARGETLDDLGRVVDARDARATLTAAECAAAGGAGTLAGVLHAWGRGRFDRAGGADLVTRLADLVALAILAALAGERDANDALAEARWTALLPARRRGELMNAVARRTASLRTLVEAHHA